MDKTALEKMMKNRKIFELKKKASEDAQAMTRQYGTDLVALAREMENLEGMLADNSDPWVIDHLATAIDDLREVVNFLRSRKENNEQGIN